LIPGTTDAPGSHERAFVCGGSQSLLHVVRRLTLADAVNKDGTRQPAAREPVGPELRFQAMSKKKNRWQQRERVHP
jgi:hypothetical protein